MANKKVFGVKGNYSTIARLAMQANATGGIYTNAFQKKIEIQRTKIHSLLSKEKDFCIELGKSFLHLEQLFLSRIESRHELLLKSQFHEYCKSEFNLKATRVRDYISVAKCKPIHQLKASFSSLVELARLDAQVLKNVLAKVNKSKLEAMSYRQMKIFVSKINTNSRKVLSPVGKKLSEKKFNEALQSIKRSFSMIRSKAKISGLDGKQKKFLEDLAKWCQSTLDKYKAKSKRAKKKPSRKSKKGGA